MAREIPTFEVIEMLCRAQREGLSMEEILECREGLILAIADLTRRLNTVPAVRLGAKVSRSIKVGRERKVAGFPPNPFEFDVPSHTRTRHVKLSRTGSGKHYFFISRGRDIKSAEDPQIVLYDINKSQALFQGVVPHGVAKNRKSLAIPADTDGTPRGKYAKFFHPIKQAA